MNKNIQGLDFLGSKRILQNLIIGLIEYHPLPWSYEGDWTPEVVNANKKTVIKTQTPEEAKEIVALANSFTVNISEKPKTEADEFVEGMKENGVTFG